MHHRRLEGRMALGSRAVWDAARINVFAIALSALWTPLNSLVLPGEAAAVAPPELRGTALGILSFLGIGIAALVQPIAGRASDRASLPDRRRPFIVLPTALSVVSLAALWWAPSWLWLLAAYVLLQACMNIAQAAFQALIPDLVRPAERGVASGVKSALDVLGTALGLLGVELLLGLRTPDAGLYGFFALALVLGAGLTWRWVPAVPPLPRHGQAPSWQEWLSPNALRQSFARLLGAPAAFQRAVAMRFLFLLGTYPTERFLLFLLADRFQVAEPAQKAGPYILGGVVLGAGGAAAAGFFSDQLGWRPVTLASISLACLGLIGVALSPSLLILAVGGGLVAVGAGSFQAVNWAVLSWAIPAGEGAQFFGLANIATAGASALAGLLGPVIDVTNLPGPVDAYHITFGLAALIVAASVLPLRGMSVRARDQS